MTHTIGHARAVPPWVFVVTLAACGGDPDSLTAPEASVASVTVWPAVDTLLFAEQAQLTATLKDVAGRVLTNRPVTWSSSDSAIATVTSVGLVSGVGPGSAAITATADGKSGAASITVRPLVFVSLSAGDLHTCGVTTDGAAYCWGSNSLGQLGNGATTEGRAPSPVSGLTFQSLSAGGLHTCGLTTEGVAYCWGFNGYGQLGKGDTSLVNLPGAVAGALRFQSVSAGGWHTCGLTTSGAAYCWGSNFDGQLGDGSTTDRTMPEAVSGALTFQSLSTGWRHTCGLTTDGAAYCWGDNGWGHLGDGSTTNRSTPEAVLGALTFQSVSPGRGHSCGVQTDGTAYCWGSNGSGQLGTGSPGPATLTPALVSGGYAYASLSAGGDHSCGLTPGGVAYCWGFNDGGQLGTGSADRLPHAAPDSVSGGLAFQQVSVGLFHTCGVTSDGSAYCWGWNSDGQLGINDTSTRRTTPVLVFGQR